MDKETKKALADILSWHEDNARELEYQQGEEDNFRFHDKACEVLAGILRAEYIKEEKNK